MCFITRDKTKHIAGRDIVVYKFMSIIKLSYAVSMFTNYIYNYNIIDTTKLDKPKKANFYIGDEFLFPDEISKDIYLLGMNRQNDVYVINTGFHSINIKTLSNKMKKYGIGYTIFKSYNKYQCLKCIIPKGSVYYRSKLGYYVSDKIIITKQKYEL